MQPDVFRNNLLRLITAKKTNPRRLSLKAGLGSTAVRDILDGSSVTPLYSTVQKLAKALGCTEVDLIGQEARPAVTDALMALRRRTGLSMADVAKALGMANASSYQRYEDPALFTKAYLPMDIAVGLAKAFAGRGKPPITEAEVMALAGMNSTPTPNEPPAGDLDVRHEDKVVTAMWLAVSAHRKIAKLEAEIAKLRDLIEAKYEEPEEPASTAQWHANMPAERLKKARIDAGYESGSDAARAFGWQIPTYLSHENGTRGFPVDVAKTYASAFRVKAAWLLGVDDE